MNSLKRILPGQNLPLRRESDVLTIFPLAKKPQPVKDHEGRKR